MTTDWFKGLSPPTERTRTASPASVDTRKSVSRYLDPVSGRFSSGCVSREDTLGSAGQPTDITHTQQNHHTLKLNKKLFTVHLTYEENFNKILNN